jgi:hypothetical protein
MKLTVGDKVIMMPTDGKISVERTSPYTNDDSGGYSFPFTVPTLPNWENLGFPGKLTRNGDIPDQEFILEENGVQVLRGVVEYDQISREDTAMLLKSGITEFYGKMGVGDTTMADKMLTDLYFGGEWWENGILATFGINGTANIDIHGVATITLMDPDIFDKITQWNDANTTDNGKYVLSPFFIKDSNGKDLQVNQQIWSGSGNTKLFIDETYVHWRGIGYFCLQFKIYWVLGKIFESQGYIIMENAMQSSEFSKAVLFGKVMKLMVGREVIDEQSSNLARVKGDETNIYLTEFPYEERLQYSYLMPDIGVVDFLKAMGTMFGLAYEVDEKRKEVRIKFKKDLFDINNLDQMIMPELQGWIHKEVPALKGMVIRYTGQDNELDTRANILHNYLTDSLPLPAASSFLENDIYKVSVINRLYINVKDSNGALGWQEFGRLTEAGFGSISTVPRHFVQVMDVNGVLQWQEIDKERRALAEKKDLSGSIEIDVKVPAQRGYDTNSIHLEAPDLKSITLDTASFLTNIPITVTLYQGRQWMGNAPNNVYFPFATFDQFSLGPTPTMNNFNDGYIDFRMSLKPDYLMSALYNDWMNWQAYRARGFTKYIELPLKDLVALQFGKRYMISGVQMILDRIKYDLPYQGVVEVDGFTA